MCQDCTGVRRAIRNTVGRWVAGWTEYLPVAEREARERRIQAHAARVAKAMAAT